MQEETKLEHRIKESEQGIADMHMAMERVGNIRLLNATTKPLGIEVLDYLGPAKFSLGRNVLCEMCGERVYSAQQAYEFRLLSAAWGPRYGYMHKGCFLKIIDVTIDNPPKNGGYFQ